MIGATRKCLYRALVLLIVLAGALPAWAAGAETAPSQQRLHALRLLAEDLAQRREFPRLLPLLNEAIDLSKAGPPVATRDSGRDLIAIASVSMPSRAYPQLEQLFRRGIELFQASADVRLGDMMVALNNLSALYDEAGLTGPRNQVMSTIVNYAEKLEQPIDEDTAQVFLSLATTYSERKVYKPAAILYRALNAYFEKRYENKPDLLAAWLAAYARVLQDDGQFDRAVAILRRLLAVLESVRAPALSVADVLSKLAAADLSAGNFEAASDGYWRAITLRISSSRR